MNINEYQYKQLIQQSLLITENNRNLFKQAKGHLQQSRVTKYCQTLVLQSIQEMENIKRKVIQQIYPIKITEEYQDHFKIDVKVVNHSANYQFVEIQARIGNICFPAITIAYFDTQSPTHKCQTFKQGGFSTVYFCDHYQNKLAIKCSKKVIGENSLAQNLDRIITQYCLQKLAASMGVGPKLLNSLGCQIAIYSNCIQFAMEVCDQIQKHPKESSGLGQQLRQNILKMHSLQFVHSDVKLENILFSPSANKFVLSDFGFSLILEQPIGMKTNTQFRGTLSSCSKQMLNLYSSEDVTREIDLYANDLQCMQKTLQLKKLQIIRQEDNHLQQQNPYYNQNIWFDISQWHYLTQAKYYCFTRKFQPLKMQFLFSLFTDQQLRQFFQFIHDLWNRRQVITFLFSQCSTYLPKQLNPSNYNKDHSINNLLNLRSIININRYSNSYLMQQVQYDPKQVYRILSSDMQVKVLNTEAYLLALSKSIDLSTTTLDKKEIIVICQIFKSFIKINQNVGTQIQDQAVIIAEVSLFLFKHSLSKKLKSQYGKIFINSINNIIFLKILTRQNLIKTIQELLQIELPNHKKAAIFLAFCSGLRILLFQSGGASLSPSFFIQVGYILQNYFIDKINSRYQLYSIQSNTFMLILLHVYRRQLGLKCCIDLNYVDKSLIKDLTLYYLLSQGFTLEDENCNQIMMIVQFKQSVQQVKFGYFHYYLMQAYFKKQDIFSAVHPLLQRHQEVVLLKQISHWKIMTNVYEQLMLSRFSFQSCKQYFDYFVSFKDTIPSRFQMLFRFITPILQKYQGLKNIQTIFQLRKVNSLVQRWTQIKYDFPQKLTPLISQGLKTQLLILKNYVAYFHIFYRFTYFDKARLSQFSRLYRRVSQFHIQQQYQIKVAKWFYLNILLVVIFFLSSKIDKALDLFRKIYLIAKITNLEKVYFILGENLRINFWAQKSIFLRIKYRFLQFKDYYLLYYEYLSKSNQLNSIFQSQALLEGTLYSCYSFAPHKLLEFTTFMTQSIRKRQSKNLVLNLIHIYERLFLIKDIQKYMESHQLIMDNLRVEDNPYNIIPLFITFLHTNLSSLRYIYQCFYKAQPFVPIIVRDYILLYIHLERQNKIGSKRRVRFLQKINNYYGFNETSLQTISKIVSKKNFKQLKKQFKKSINQRIFLKKLQRLIQNVRFKNSISNLQTNNKQIKFDIRPLKMNLQPFKN